MTDALNTERETIALTYVGRRISNKNALMFVFMSDDGELRAYDKLRASVIGGRYSIEQSIGTTRVFSNTLTYLDHKFADDAQIAEWATIDRADSTRVETIRLEKRAAKSENEFDAMIAPLREQYDKTIGYAKRAALIAAIIESVTR